VSKKQLAGRKTSRTAQKLAVDGGPKALPKVVGKAQHKIGVEEFMSVAERFGFKPAALKRIRKTISNDDFAGPPFLARYYSPYPEKNTGPKFEALGRKKFGVKYALSVSSGTGALHSAFVAAGVGPGTEVIVPALGFAATAAAVIMAGGVPVFSDVDESLEMDPRAIEKRISKRTVALAPTHCSGGVCDMGPICKVARKHGLKVIEDCAQAPGAKYAGRYVGTLGDIGCFSISGYKIIGGGEGGMVVTDDLRLYERACQCAEFGGLWRPDRFAPPRYKGELFAGTNYRMSEMEAAVDLVQLGKLDDVVGRFQRASRRIRRQLYRYKQIVPQKINDARGHIGYVLRFFPATFELSSKIAAALNAEGVGCYTRGRKPGPDWHIYYYMFPITLKTGHIRGGSVFEDPRYLRRGGHVEYARGQCPVAEDLYAREVMIGINQWFAPEDCDKIAAGINKVLSAYCTRIPGKRGWL
jgi:dTDP-4-amino-4,6-dideoxygalactose transaminase